MKKWLPVVLWLVLCLLLPAKDTFAHPLRDTIADRMLLYQRESGGWPKAVNNIKVDYSNAPDSLQCRYLRDTRSREDATIDNEATCREIRYLMLAFRQTGNTAYRYAAVKGIKYLLEAQYANGGWPQYYPDRRLYRAQVTFNDHAMTNVLDILLSIRQQDTVFAPIGDILKLKATRALQKGLDCVLHTQLLSEGKPGIWAAQYEPRTLIPAKARSFEPASLATMESAGILLLLMKIQDPSAEVVNAVHRGVAWFFRYRLDHTAVLKTRDTLGKVTDVQVLRRPGAVLWARFYDIATVRPLFCGRDGVVKARLEDIPAERKTGYAWYGQWGITLFCRYLEWVKQQGEPAFDPGLCREIQQLVQRAG